MRYMPRPERRFFRAPICSPTGNVPDSDSGPEGLVPEVLLWCGPVPAVGLCHRQSEVEGFGNGEGEVRDVAGLHSTR